MAVIVGSVSGIISTNDPIRVIGMDDAMEAVGLQGTGRIVTRLLTFFNPNTSAAPFILRKRVLDENDEERFIRRFDESIAPNKPWIFGSNGGILVIDNVEDWYEFKLDSNPTQPIEFCIDFGVTI